MSATHGTAVTPPATFRRRRLMVLVALLGLMVALGAALGTVGAQAELDDPVAGHAVIEPGATLWEVARSSTPDGVDPREHLRAIQELNGIDGAEVEPWTVVLLPAR